MDSYEECEENTIWNLMLEINSCTPNGKTCTQNMPHWGAQRAKYHKTSKVARVNSGYLVSLLTFGIFLIRKVNFASLFQEQVNS